jgi:hypothetical protein
MVVLGVSRTKTVQNTSEDTNYHGERKRKQTNLRLVHTVASVGEPLDKLVRSVTKAGKCDKRGDDLACVNIAGG